MFIELHTIQSFGPTNLNRDDLNNPKECLFGGVRRARISSQCIKRAVREHPLFKQTTQVDNATRTRWMTNMIRDALKEAKKPKEDVDTVAIAFASAYAVKMDSKVKDKTKVLVYFSPAEVADAASMLLEQWKKGAPAEKAIGEIAEKLIKKYEKITNAPDLALFGRMLADQTTTRLDAACQVAHAVSTHAVKMETDFFTAVDDLQPEGTVGAGMMGYIGFNSACYYRYARIDWQQLITNLKQDRTRDKPNTDEFALARRTVEGFLRAWEAATPTGMKNSHDNNGRPAFLLGVVRTDGVGWSLANAFERPVRPLFKSGWEGGYVIPSVKSLDVYWNWLCQVYGAKQIKRVAALVLDPMLMESEEILNHLKHSLVESKKAQVSILDAWIEEITNALPDGKEGA
jgi:CRISPR system Cascade subunit CasC